MDFDDIHKLLQVADLSNKWPELRNIHNAALAKLREHNDGHKGPEPKKETVRPIVAPPMRRPVGGPDAA